MTIAPHNHLRSLFLLDPTVTFLNHGSFGATPKPVFEAYQRYQLELEREPVDFLGRRANDLLGGARKTLGEFLGTSADNLTFVTNATTGMNIVARSLELSPGDEVLSTDHEYGAVDRTWHFLAKKQGFTYINQPIQAPVTTQEAWIEQFWRGVTPRTKVITFSHITSPTALIFPVKQVCRLARENGILTIIDGAHAPGQIDLALDDLSVDFYTGNLHKWLCAQKGAAFLFAHPGVQHLIQPLVVSWGYESSSPGSSTFIDYTQWTGTRDLSAFLAVVDAIRFQQSNDWQSVRADCHALAEWARHRISSLGGLPPLSPASSVWFAQMVCAPLPQAVNIPDLARFLWDEKRIEIPLIEWNGRKLVRISIQGYNSQEDIDCLGSALDEYYKTHSIA